MSEAVGLATSKGAVEGMKPEGKVTTPVAFACQLALLVQLLSVTFWVMVLCPAFEPIDFLTRVPFLKREALTESEETGAPQATPPPASICLETTSGGIIDTRQSISDCPFLLTNKSETGCDNWSRAVEDVRTIGVAAKAEAAVGVKATNRLAASSRLPKRTKRMC